MKNELTDKQISNILKKKRMNGQTCSIHRQIGIKYMGDRGMFDKMLDWEIDYYNKHHKRNLNE